MSYKQKWCPGTFGQGCASWVSLTPVLPKWPYRCKLSVLYTEVGWARQKKPGKSWKLCVYVVYMYPHTVWLYYIYSYSVSTYYWLELSLHHHKINTSDLEQTPTCILSMALMANLLQTTVQIECTQIQQVVMKFCSNCRYNYTYSFMVP